MAYRIDYFKETTKIASLTSDASQEATEQVAKEGMGERGADFYRIIDVDGSGAEVASGRSNT